MFLSVCREDNSSSLVADSHSCDLRLQVSTVQYSAAQYSTLQHSTVQYSTVQAGSLGHNAGACCGVQIMNVVL